MGPARKYNRVVLIGASLIGIGLALFAVIRLVKSPDVALLFSEHGAKWIVPNEPVDLKAHVSDETKTCFRKQFTTRAGFVKASLYVRAMKIANVMLDGQFVYNKGQNLAEWKNERVVPLNVSAGVHDLRVFVMNQNGPVCLLAYSPELGLTTGADWETSPDSKTWAGTSTVDTPVSTEVSRRLPPVHRAFLSVFLILFLVFTLVFLGVILSSLFAKRNAHPLPIRLFCPSTCRWVFLAAWIVLAANNIWKLPAAIGFDVPGHVEYIQFVMDHWRLPLATDGWTMFQAPLYYVLAAIVNGLWVLLVKPEWSMYRWYAVRIISVAAGMAQIEICFRCMRSVWPGRDDLQIAGTFFAGFLPMNLYIAQYAGNEPLTASLVAMVVMFCIKYLSDPESARNVRAMALLGLLLGLAGLSKMTALVMMLPVAVVLMLLWWEGDGDARYRVSRFVSACAIVFGVAVMICGWYYLRNWLLLGRPFWGGWEPERQIVWWQYPGYRTPAQFARFGQCLEHPALSGLTSFWDGFYSTLWLDGYLSSMINPDYPPPWNLNLMLSGAWLALAPTLAILAGFSGVFRKDAVVRRAATFSVGCLLLYMAALLYGFLTVPYYCIVKASYTLGLIPCYAVLLTAGLSLCRKPVAKALAYGALAAWGAAAYAAYFIWHAP